MNVSVLSLPVLVLNANWQPIGEKTVRRAFEDITSGREEMDDREFMRWIVPFRPMDIEIDPTGELVYANPVDFGQWVDLPVRPGDDFIFTGRRHIRVPRVIISTNFSKTVVREVRLTRSAIHRRDRQQCQYCHKFFPLDELNVDHVVPKYHGGEDTWDNLVCSCKACNTKKGHKHNHQIGYKLLHQPVEPRPIPVVATLTVAKHPSWAPFLTAAKSS